jgi:hypothetical protein
MTGIDVRILLGLLFLGLSCVAFFSMLHLLGTPHTSRARTLRVVHRASGAIAVILYIVLALLCIMDMVDGRALSAVTTVHLVSAALFIPLILLKILIVERYPELRNRLFGVGSALFAIIFVTSFTSIFVGLAGGIADGPEIEPAEIRETSEEDLSLGRELFVLKCSKCHRLDRPLGTRRSAEEWIAIVEAMRQKDRAWIGEAEADKITRFLISLGGTSSHD